MHTTLNYIIQLYYRTLYMYIPLLILINPLDTQLFSKTLLTRIIIIKLHLWNNILSRYHTLIIPQLIRHNFQLHFWTTTVNPSITLHMESVSWFIIMYKANYTHLLEKKMKLGTYLITLFLLLPFLWGTDGPLVTAVAALRFSSLPAAGDSSVASLSTIWAFSAWTAACKAHLFVLILSSIAAYRRTCCTSLPVRP